MRSRVLVELDTCETAGDMEVKLNGSVDSAGEELPRSPFPYAGWGPWAGVLGVLIALVLGAILGLPAVIADNPGPGEDLGTAASVVVQLATALGFLIVPFALAMIRGAGSLREAGRRLGLRGFEDSAVLWMGATVVAYFAFAVLYATLIGEPSQEDIAEKLGPVAVQVVLIAIMAPISEEVCFRGMLFGGLRRRMPALPAALISGAIFGGLHATTGVSAVPPLIVFGVLLALLYERTGSIVPGIILHMLNNSVALLAQ
jgi:membrane protease YdiL (CAAX protease family)